MANSVLSDILDNQVSLDLVIDWLSENENDNHTNFACSKGEFASHFLNFIHEEALSFEKCRQTIQKSPTPKSIKKIDSWGKPRRRPALFPDRTTKSPNPRRRSLQNEFPKLSTPLSPLYNFPSAHNVEVKPSPSKSICLNDFISPKRTPSSRSPFCHTPSSQRARICPTNLTQCNSTILPPKNSYDFTLETQKHQTSPTPPSILQEIELDIDSITPTDKTRLQSFARIFVHLIESQMTLHSVSEMYFIITLLLSKQFASDTFTSTTFSSINHIMIFALESLQCMIHPHSDLVHLFDATTLRLLQTHPRTSPLPSQIWQSLSLPSNDTFSIDVLNKPTSSPNQVPVCFDSDTDNREHFPSDASFHAFRKQRDLFYDILQTWQMQHSSTEFTFAHVIGSRVRNLLAMHPDPANFRHLSRLFKSQLLSDAARSQNGRQQEDDIPSTLPNVSAEKLSRLQSRLNAKEAQSNIAPFPDAQEFYRDFILFAQHAIFNAHLRNALINDLLEGSTVTIASDTYDIEDETRAVYVRTVRTLQILARFVALIDAAPYKCANERIQLEDLETRAWTTPSIDLRAELAHAKTSSRLIIVLPWITEYLALLDVCTLRLPYFEALYEQLFSLHFNSAAAPQMAHLNRVYIRCCLGALFEMPHFPSETYFTFLSRFEESSRGMENDSPSSGGLDHLPIVTSGVLHALCPCLAEFKKLLLHERCRSARRKHIVPVTTTKPEAGCGSSNDRKLKAQLEEALLASKPSSVRRTVEFVSERIASSIVKSICSCHLPAVKQSVADGQQMALLRIGVCEQMQTEHAQMIESHLRKLREACELCMRTQLNDKIRCAVRALMSCDDCAQTVDACAEMAGRMCEQRVKHWIAKHINGEVFKEFEYDAERMRKLLRKLRIAERGNRRTLPVLGLDGVQHIDSDDDEGALMGKVWNPAKLLTRLQRACMMLSQTFEYKVSPLGEGEEDLLLECAGLSKKHRCDLSEMSWHLINQLLMDLLILNAAVCPRSELVDKFLTFWTSQRADVDGVVLKEVFQGCLSVRNVHILHVHSKDAGDAAGTWQMYAQILCGLLRLDLLSVEDFEMQCLGIFRQNWDADVLEKFSQCLQCVGKAQDANNRFTFLLSFLADYCADLEF